MVRQVQGDHAGLNPTCTGARLCYDPAMTSDLAGKRRRTRLEPVTTMEEVPVLNDKERADLIGSLQQAQADTAAGKGSEFDPDTFRECLLDVYRRKRR